MYSVSTRCVLDEYCINMYGVCPFLCMCILTQEGEIRCTVGDEFDERPLHEAADCALRSDHVEDGHEGEHEADGNGQEDLQQ